MAESASFYPQCPHCRAGVSPAAIVLVGDLFEHQGDPAKLTPVMERLSAPMGVWAVRGNHDALRPGRRDVTGEVLGGAGIRLLANEWAMMAEGLLVAGIDDLTTSARRRPGEGEANIARAFSGKPPGTTLFLSHTPWMTDQAASAGVDLMISGHTHNGQIWPFNYLVRTRYPFIKGRYDINVMTLLVSRGTPAPGGPACASGRRAKLPLLPFGDSRLKGKVTMGIRMKWGKPSPLQPEEQVILEQRRFRAISSFTIPSYRIGFNFPPLWKIRLLVTNRRCLVWTDFFHCMTQEIVMWFPGQNPAEDPEVITRISCRKGLFGRCLEIRTHNPERRQRWLWSPDLTLRFFLKYPQRIESAILTQMCRPLDAPCNPIKSSL